MRPQSMHDSFSTPRQIRNILVTFSLFVCGTAHAHSGESDKRMQIILLDTFNPSWKLVRFQWCKKANTVVGSVTAKTNSESVKTLNAIEKRIIV